MIPHVSIPTAGHYRLRLRKGAPWSAVRIWQGFGTDPLTGETLERGWIWRATLNGVEVRPERVWPNCAGEPIDRAEHDYLVAIHRHAVEHEPDLPEAAPYTPVDWSKLSFDFGKAPT